MTTETKKTGLDLLREPFANHLISKLPKPTKQQTDAVKADFKTGIRCQLCGAWHHKDVVHLDYVGHAALTDRLLDCDPNWNWEPVSTDEHGLPFVDRDGGMWIKLTVCGVTRLGYGDAEGKLGANATKERIGDCLRNAAMRFGAALDLWSKANLHFDDHEQKIISSDEIKKTHEIIIKSWSENLDKAQSVEQLNAIWADIPTEFKKELELRNKARDIKLSFTQGA